MDIGGGSLELAMSADGLLDRLVSLPYGAIRMTEQFLGLTPRRKDVRALRSHVRDEIRKALPLRDWRGSQLICSGGTFTNLAGIFLYRQGTTSAAGRVQGTRVPREELEHIIDLLKRHGIDEIVVTVAFMANSIRNYFGDGSEYGVTMTYAAEEWMTRLLLGFGASVRVLEPASLAQRVREDRKSVV